MLLIVIEHAHGAPRKSALELVTLGRALAAATDQPLAALVVGAEPDAVADVLVDYVADVHTVQDARLEPARAEMLTRAVAAAAESLSARTVLMPASRSGLALAPRVALRLQAAYLEDVTALTADGDGLVATRPSYLARVTSTVATTAEVVVASVKSGSAPAATPLSERGRLHPLQVEFMEEDERLEVMERHTASRGRVALEDADVVVCGGRGLGSREAFERHVVGLAERLGAGVGATRAVVDAGWRPYGEQIGQTGKTVSPRLYVALAVSGAVQHLSGMNRAGVVVAVNSDRDAPIFRVADYGIVGDVAEVVPALEEALAGQG